jgi:hypothetical protein
MRELEKKAKDEEEGGHVSSTNHSSLHSGQSSHFTAAYIQVSPHILQQLIFRLLLPETQRLTYRSSSVLHQPTLRLLFPEIQQLTLKSVLSFTVACS